jgi:hypothetical protein
MLFRADLGGRQKPVGDGQQSDFPIAMPEPIDRNGFGAQVDGGEMAAGDVGRPHYRGAKQPAERY